jgi:hypothetical protein
MEINRARNSILMQAAASNWQTMLCLRDSKLARGLLSSHVFGKKAAQSEEEQMTKHRVVKWLLVSLVLAGFVGCPVWQPESTWAWQQSGDVLEVAYGNAVAGWPQMVALHLDTSALRMVYGSGSGWGPTVYLAPSLWTNEASEGERYHLGAPVMVAISEVGDDLVLQLTGTIGGLPFATTVEFAPPGDDVFEAHVSIVTTGAVTLADRPGEAFKPVHVASMHISETQWDSSAISAGGFDHALPADGWVLPLPGIAGNAFALVGGSSTWKPNAPSIAISLDRAMLLQGWVTLSSDPNDDNVGFWCATDTVLPSWTYDITALKPTK